MKQEIVTMIKGLVGFQYLYFDTPLLIKLTPHTWPVQIWAATVSPSGEIYLMDDLMNGDEQWFQLEESDRNYDIVLATLYQRIKTIYKQAA